MTVLALDTSQANNVGIATIAAVILIGLLLVVLISKLVVRAIVVVLMVILAVVAYQQRHQLQHDARSCDATFFGVHITPHDQSVKQRCLEITNPHSK
jgi:disulfide bond formation protein DsbB